MNQILNDIDNLLELDHNCDSHGALKVHPASVQSAKELLSKIDLDVADNIYVTALPIGYVVVELEYRGKNLEIEFMPDNTYYCLCCGCEWVADAQADVIRYINDIVNDLLQNSS